MGRRLRIEPTHAVGIRFTPSNFGNLEVYSEKYFEADRTKAVNAIVADFFRKRQKALQVMSDNKGYTPLTAFQS